MTNKRRRRKKAKIIASHLKKKKNQTNENILKVKKVKQAFGCTLFKVRIRIFKLKQLNCEWHWKITTLSPYSFLPHPLFTRRRSSCTTSLDQCKLKLNDSRGNNKYPILATILCASFQWKISTGIIPHDSEIPETKLKKKKKKKQREYKKM